LQVGLVDCDTIQIINVLDNEGRVEVASEEQLYAILGLQKEDGNEKKDMEGRGEDYTVQNECHDNLAAIPIFQRLAGERRLFDKNTLVMEPESVYPSMKELRLAMRQYAIDKEFEFNIEATDKMSYKGYCHCGDCPWSINARVE
jgi:hypothetical protein